MMKRSSIFLWTVPILLTALPLTCLAGDDWELWTELKWKKKVSPELSLQGGSYTRFRRDLGEFYKQGGYVIFSAAAKPYLKVEPGYLYEFSERPRSHDTVSEHRLLLNLIPHTRLGRLHLEDRSRIEFRRINGVEDWRYRNKPKIALSLWKGSFWEAAPYLADEAFYGFRAGEWNRNRFFVGVEKRLTRRLSAELYVMVESNKTGSDWAEFHVLGLTSTVSF